jgi:3-mercaptopyruvate sulfurtransferase SseA
VAVRHVAEVSVLADEYLGERAGLEQVSTAELELRLARGDVVVLDVRPETEFRAGHIAGARSVPLSALDAVAATCPGGGRSLRTAAARIACTPTTPSACCALAA